MGRDPRGSQMMYTAVYFEGRGRKRTPPPIPLNLYLLSSPFASERLSVQGKGGARRGYGCFPWCLLFEAMHGQHFDMHKNILPLP